MRSLFIRECVANELELAEGGSHEGEAERKAWRSTDDGICGGGIDVGGLKAEGDWSRAVEC